LAKGTNRTVVKVIKKSAKEDSGTCQSVYNNNMVWQVYGEDLYTGDLVNKKAKAKLH